MMKNSFLIIVACIFAFAVGFTATTLFLNAEEGEQLFGDTQDSLSPFKRYSSAILPRTSTNDFGLGSSSASASAAFSINISGDDAHLFSSGTVTFRSLQNCNLDTDANGLITCGTDSGGGGAFGLREGYSGSFTNIGSLSFNQPHFNLVTSGTRASLSLDWTNGPASRAANETITGLWEFRNDASISNVLYTQNGGNVGIGTTNPSTKLHVGPGVGALTLPDGTGTTFTPELSVQDASGIAALGVGVADGTNNRRAGFFVDNTNSLWGLTTTFTSGGSIPFVIRSASTERLRVDANSNVGIAVTTPEQRLDVAGNILASASDPFLRINSTDEDDADFSLKATGTSGSVARLDILSSASSALVTIASSGNVGIGTTAPNGKLNIVGSPATGGVGTDYFRISSTSADRSFFMVASSGWTLARGAAIQPRLVATNTSPANLGSPSSLAVSGKLLFVGGQVTGGSGISILDISNPASPTFQGRVSTADDPLGIFIAGKYAYVTVNVGDDLQIIDFSNPRAPTTVGLLSDGTNLNGARGIFVSGRYAYVSNLTDDSLAIVDVSNPTAPTFVAKSKPGVTRLDAPGLLTVRWPYAYVAGNTTDNIVVFNISNPSSPSYVSEVRGGGLLDQPHAVEMSGDYLFVTTQTRDSLAVIDVSNPASPSFVAETRGKTGGTTLNSAFDVAIEGRFAYVSANARDSISVIDISNPASPTWVMEYRGPTPGTSLDLVRDLVVANGYLYTALFQNEAIATMDVRSADIPNLVAGSIGVQSLHTYDLAKFDSMVSVRGGLDVGGNTLLQNGLVVYGSQSLFLGGNMGIGTTNPTAQLELVNTTSASIRLTSSDTTLTTGQHTGNIEFYSNDVQGVGVVARIANVSAGATNTFGNLVFYTGSTPSTLAEEMRLTSAGNLGIGVTTPEVMLDIAGDILASSTGDVDLTLNNLDEDDAKFTIRSNGAAGSTAQFEILGSVSQQLVILASNGNFRITGMLDLTATDFLTFPDTTRSILYSTGAVGSAWPFTEAGHTIQQPRTSGANRSLLFVTGTTESVKMRVDHNGNVGINSGVTGTTGPIQKLAVGGNILASASDDTSLILNSIDTEANAGLFKITASGGVGVEKLLITNDANTPLMTISSQGSVVLPLIANNNANDYVCWITATGEVTHNSTACGTSSLRFKENVRDLDIGLAEVLKLRPVLYDLKEEFGGNKNQPGFIAEEAVEVVPYLVGLDEEGKPLNFDYPKYVSVLTKAIHEQQDQIEALKEQIASLDGRSDGIFERIWRWFLSLF